MSQSRILEFLLQLQESCGGAIPIDHYMREALYHPEFGYYSKNIRTVGRRGDFATSASLGRVLGLAIDGWICSKKRSCVRLNVIEVGAGSGAMAKTVLGSMGFLGRIGIRYHIVETSPVLRAEQQNTLKRQRVTWHTSMQEALKAVDGKAAVFSNELIDAFPCRVFEKREDTWHEVAIRIEGTNIGEVLLSGTPPPAASALTQNHPDGQRVEVHTSAGEWMASWSHLAREIDILTIDYGERHDTLYHRRPRGTLRAYFHQQRLEGSAVFHRFGKQDITADVNFSDLECWGKKLDWQNLHLQSQGEFIREFVPEKEIEKSPADAALADLSGAGDAFKVLHQKIRNS